MITIGGVPLQHGTLTMPRRGVWHLEGVIDDDSGFDPGTLANVEIEGGATLFGVVRRGGVALEISEVQIVGGAGGLSNEIPSAGYNSATARIIIQDILTACGESLATSSDAAITSTQLAQWSRARGAAGAALDDITNAIGMTWRVLDDGTVWVGVDAWTTQPLAADAEIVDSIVSLSQRVYADETLSLRPGRTVEGIRVEHVIHRIAPEAFRTDVFAPRESSSEDTSPLRAALASFITRVMRRTDYHALYPARVVSQGVDDTIDVRMDDSKMPALSKVPIRTFAPEVVIKVTPGARVLIGFEAGDPRLPYASLWQSGAVVSVALAGNSDAAALAALVLARLTSIQSDFNSHTHLYSPGPSPAAATATPVPVMGAPAPVASSKLLLGG